ncbi:MAG: hypothetical protein WD688_20900 [Candidatus Binatia bacterium]
MDKDWVLKVTEAGAVIRLGITAYQGVTEPNHRCQDPKPLRRGDVVTVKNMTPTSVLVTGPCGCDFLLWDRLPAASGENDSLLDRVRQWMIVRFALNTDHDLWVWPFVIGVAAHLELLAIGTLWVADQKPTSFEQYQPKMTLGQASHLIHKKNLLNPTTVDNLKRIAKLRNSVVHRGATYGIPFQEGDPSRGEYKGRHVFTDLEGLKQLMDDVDAATKVMGEWLRKPGLGTGEGTST